MAGRVTGVNVQAPIYPGLDVSAGRVTATNLQAMIDPGLMNTGVRVTALYMLAVYDDQPIVPPVPVSRTRSFMF